MNHSRGLTGWLSFRLQYTYARGSTPSVAEYYSLCIWWTRPCR